jgi:hypothetical protein
MCSCYATGGNAEVYSCEVESFPVRANSQTTICCDGLWALTFCLLLLHFSYGPGHFQRPGRSSRLPARDVLVSTAVLSNKIC